MLQKALLLTVIFAISLNAASFNEASEKESVDSEAATSESSYSKTVEASDSVKEGTNQQVESRSDSVSETGSGVERQNSADLRSQKMQQCLSLVDKNVLQRFKGKGLRLNRDIKKLCHDKQRNQAQSQAVGFAVEIQRSKDMSVFRYCGKIIDQSSSTMGQIMKTYFASDLRYIHICDRHIP